MKTQCRASIWQRALIGIALIGLLFGALGAPALAEEGGQPPSLVNATPVSGELAGTRHGSFASFQIAYPGGKADLRVQATFNPYSYQQGLGFEVFGPNDFEGRGVWKEAQRLFEFSYSDDDPATLVVQLFNYTTKTVAYSIAANGIPTVEQTAAAAGAAAPTATPAAPTEVASEGVSGVLVGKVGGAYAVHTIKSSGAGEDVTVTMTFSPEEPSYAKAFGFIVYAANGAVVAHGVSTGVLGQRKATFAAADASDYTVQVYNYADGVALNYALNVSR